MPATAANTSARRPARFQQIEINEVLDKNVHALEHYLQNPKVHIALFRALYGMSALISETDEDAALSGFATKAAAIKLDGIKTELQKLAESVGVDVDAFLNAAEAYNAIMNF